MQGRTRRFWDRGGPLRQRVLRLEPLERRELLTTVAFHWPVPEAMAGSNAGADVSAVSLDLSATGDSRPWELLGRYGHLGDAVGSNYGTFVGPLSYSEMVGDPLYRIGKTADAILAAQQQSLGLSDPLGQLMPSSISVDGLGMTHLRFQQMVDNAPLLGSQIDVYLAADGSVASAEGSIVADIEIDTTPADSLMPTLAVEQLLTAGGEAVQVDAYSVPSLADWNADGKSDLLVGEKTAAGEGKVRVYLNSGTAAAPAFGSWFYAQANGGDLSVAAAGCMGVFPRLVDFDGDGRNDLVTGLADGRVQLWPNVGTNTNPQFDVPSFLEVGPVGAKQDIQVGARATLDISDWNNDGHADLIAGGLDGRIHVFLNQASSGVADFQADIVVQAGGGDLVVPSGRSSPAIVDFDGDGRKDLVVGNTEGQLLLYGNVGTDAAPLFGDGQSILVGDSVIDLAGTPRTRPAVCDWNRDGLPDLLVGAADGQVRLYLGAGPASTADPRSPLRLQDAAGQPVEVRFNADTLVVAVATWCPYSRKFRDWLATPEMRQQTVGLDVVFVLGNESAKGAGAIYDTTFLDDLPGRAVFLATDSLARPTSFPTVYDPVQGLFGELHGVPAVESWLATKSLAPEVDYASVSESSSASSGSCSADTGGGQSVPFSQNPAPATFPPPTTGSQLGTPARVVNVTWQTDAADMAEGSMVAAAALTSSISPPVAARFDDLPSNTMGLAADGSILSDLHAVSSRSDLAAAGVVADGFLRNQAALLGLANPVEELVPQEVLRDQLDMTHVVYGQFYQGVPVFGGELRVHMDGDQRLTSANGRIVSGIQLDTTPAISLDQAIAAATWYFQAEFGANTSTSTLVVRSGDLYVFDASLIEDAADPVPRLVWQVRLVEENAWIDQTYLMDAVSGKLRLKLDNVRGINRKVYDCSAAPGTDLCGAEYEESYNNQYLAWTPPPDTYIFGRIEASVPHGPNPRYLPEQSTDNDTLYDLLAVVHEYYLVNFGRNGANGIGGNNDGSRAPKITADMDAGRTYLNWLSTWADDCIDAVYWSDAGVCFCKNTVIPDVVGHEYAHGVLTRLVYQGESGSLNESHSDVIGEMFEYWMTGSNDWVLGGALPAAWRNIADPPTIVNPWYTLPYPDRYLSSFFVVGGGGEIHHNSTVISKAFYLMSEGGTFNGYTISGLGRDKMEQVLYRAATTYYSANATFNEAYFDILQAAGDLYGAEDVAQVQNALRAVEIDHTRGSQPASEVINRHVFYNNSAYDTGPARLDDDAIAPNQEALVWGQAATGANYTNYSRGINGAMIDVAHLVNYVTVPTGLTAADFEFRMGNTPDPSTWTAAPAPQAINFDGKQGRININWADGEIADRWLQVTLKANATTHLDADAVFYYGNLVGDVDGDFAVTTADAAAVTAAVDPLTPVGIENPFDLNRDGFVDTADVLLAQDNVGQVLLDLDLTGTPQALAGGPYTVPEGGAVVLGGSAIDVDSPLGLLTFAWDLDGDGTFGETGAAATRGDETGATPTFDATGLDGFVGSEVTVTLRVTDESAKFDEDTATIAIANVAPTADAGEPYVVPEGAAVLLSGSGTDPGGVLDPLTFAWDLNNDGVYDDAFGATPTVPWATLAGFGLAADGTVLPIHVQVDDGDGGISTDSTTLTLNTIRIDGTPENDVISFTTSPTQHVVTINGEPLGFDPATISIIHIDGLGGNDTITITGTEQDETVVLTPGSVNVFGQSYQLHAARIETITVDAGIGSDQATLTGSAGSNRLYSYGDHATLADSPRSYSYRVENFETVGVNAAGDGRDYAYLYDAPGADKLIATPVQAVLTRAFDTVNETVTTASGFQRVYAYATQGEGDVAKLTGADTAANRFYGYADYAVLTESRRAYYFYARGFDGVTGESPGDEDSYAYLYDSLGVDTFEASPESATMTRAEPWSDTTATGFNRVYSYSTQGGDDTAVLIGNPNGGNNLRAYPTYSTLTDSARSFYHYARGFHSVTGIGSQTDPSGDRAYLYDSPGDDTFTEAFLEDGKYQGGSLSDAATYENWIKYFDLVYARSSDTGTNDEIHVTAEEALAYNLMRMGTWD